HLVLDLLADLRRVLVDVELAVEVVGLVLEGPGPESLALVDDLVPLGVVAPHPGPQRPHGGQADTGEREASLAAVLEVGSEDLDLGVDDLGGEAVAAVDDEHPLEPADLVGSEPDARVDGIHRLEELVDELADLGVEHGDRLGAAAQDRVAPEGDGGTGRGFGGVVVVIAHGEDGTWVTPGRDQVPYDRPRPRRTLEA